jgi:hypothetical protein
MYRMSKLKFIAQQFTSSYVIEVQRNAVGKSNPSCVALWLMIIIWLLSYVRGQELKIKKGKFAVNLSILSIQGNRKIYIILLKVCVTDEECRTK